MRNQNDNKVDFVLLRGPILVGAVLVSIAISVLQNLSWLSITQISLLGFGCALACYDSVHVGHNRFRRYLKVWLEDIVWDDVMYKFFHPDFVWYKYFTETLLGQAAWVYALPSTPTQRRHLLQSTLNIMDEDEARRILFVPGGYQKLLLPESFLRWLDNDGADQCRGNTRENRSMHSSEGRQEHCVDSAGNDMASSGDAASSSSSVSGQASEQESEIDFEAPEFSIPFIARSSTAKKYTNKEDEKEKTEGSALNQPTTRTTARPPTTPIPSIKDTMQSIIFDTLSTQFQDFLAVAPDRKQTAALGLCAAASLAFQLRYSKRSRSIALGFLEASSVAGLSAMTLGAGVLFLGKCTSETGSFQLNAKSLVPYIKTILSWKKVVTNSSTGRTSDSHHDRWRKACFAAACFILFSLRRRRQSRQQCGQ